MRAACSPSWGVREGRSYLITAHGTPIARLTPAGTPDRTMARARSVLMKRLRSQKATDIGTWRREELYG